MDIVVIGTGYVGLVTGTCLADMGNNVTCVDIDQKKIDDLKQGILPIYEPGLDELVHKNIERRRLNFTVSLPEAMSRANLFFIAVGTPPLDDGSANLDYVFSVAREIGKNIKQYAVVVDKSTVPVGTAEKVSKVIAEELHSRDAKISFDVLSNPEFLREGSAVKDFMEPDRIIIGTESQRAAAIMEELYASFKLHDERLIFMGTRDAEMTKYAANAMLATKISFMNEISCLCDEMGADVENIRLGIGSDTRIGHSFIFPGCGYGGSCFPKDVKALISMAKQHDFEPKVLNAVEARNADQKTVLYNKLSNCFNGDLNGVTVAVWGLAFKPETDDMREASSVTLIHKLVAAGVNVRAYDPVAMIEAKKMFPRSWFEKNKLIFVQDQYHALRGTDALMLVTEWNSFRNPDYHLMREIMNRPTIIDGRNIYEPEILTGYGFEYIGVGRRQGAAIPAMFSIQNIA